MRVASHARGTLRLYVSLAANEIIHIGNAERRTLELRERLQFRNYRFLFHGAFCSSAIKSTLRFVFPFPVSLRFFLLLRRASFLLRRSHDDPIAQS